MPFPKTVNSNQAPAVRGDFASMNPFSSILAPNQGQLVAPAGGLTVARFCFVNPADGTVRQNYVSGDQIGFLGRNEQALITLFLGETSYVVPQGFMVTLFNKGDFWARFAGGATIGQSVYADTIGGHPISGSATDTVTASAGSTGTLTTNATAGTLNQVTLNTVSAGVVNVGDVVTSTNVPTGTTVTGQISGAAGGTGVYTLSANASAAAGPTAFTTVGTIMTVTAVLTGGLDTGDVLSGTNVTAGTTITALGTGVGGVGTYVLSVAQNFGPTTVTVVGGNVITQFKVASNCLPGEIAKISAWA